MKWLVLFACSLFAVNASAVPTKNCPNRLTVSYQDIEMTVSFEQIKKDYSWYEEEQLKAVEIAYGNVDLEPSVTLAFDLETAKNGRCVYRRLHDDSIAKIELYTTRKQNLFMMQALTGNDTRGILARVYAKIDSLSQDEVKLKNVKPGLALAIPRYPYTDYYAGGDLVFVGKVNDLKVSVE